MEFATEPHVHVVGRLQLDYDAIDEYLGDHGTSWERDVPQDHTRDLELASEFAGRVCYDAFGAAQYRRSNEAYLGNIIESAHGCYDEETEVLTAQGWKRWPDVTERDRLATRTITECVEYHHPTRLISYLHRGRMYRVDGRGVDLLVTPDHKMLACPTTTKEGRRREKYELIQADALGTRAHAYIKDATWLVVDHNILSDDEARLLGFSIGDGSMFVNGGTVGGKKLRFHLRRERKILWLRALTQRLRWDMQENAERDEFVVSVPDDKVEIFRSMYNAEREKVIPQELLTLCPSYVLEGLLEGLMQSDGHQGRTGDCFDTTSQTLVGQMQQLCLHVGIAAHVGYTYDRERRASSYGEKPLTRLHLVRRGLRPEVNRFVGQEGRSYWIDEWEGQVYCAEVPNHTLYVRRNGIPVWSGNSVVEHPTLMLLITNVSRSLTHELIRHRVGVAYSQRSQRYVDERGAVFIVPSLIERYPDVMGEWIQAMANAQKSYLRINQMLAEHIERDQPDAKKRDRRIQAKQAARSVLPNATETRIVVTMNMRTMRHIVEVRGGIGAEAEIRRLACLLAEIGKKEAPNLFADVEVTELEDGAEGVRILHHKV